MAEAGFSFEEASKPAGFSFDEAAKPSDEPTFFRQFGRQLGLTARAAAMGAAFPARAIGGVLGMDTSGAMERTLSRIGLPEPGNETERVVQDVAGSMVGAGGLAKGAELAITGGRSAGQGIARLLADRAGIQIASAGAGGAGAGTAREMGGGPVAQTAAGVISGVAPFAGIGLTGAIRAGIRGTGAKADKFADTAGLYERGIGITPSTGQASENLLTEGLESGLSRFPGGNIPIVKLAKAEEVALGRKVERMAGSIAPAGTKMTVGKQIEEGITGPGGYMEKVKEAGKIIYDNLDSKFGNPEYPVPVANTKRFLDSLTAKRPGAEHLLATLENAKVIEIKRGMTKDLQGKPGTTITLLGPDGQPLSTVSQGGQPAGTTIPFDAWKLVRSRVGELIGAPQLPTDISRTQLRALYRSMSEDIRDAAITRDTELARAGVISPGRTPTLDAVNGANKSMKFVHDRIDDILEPVMRAGGPENIYRAATAGTRDGDTTLRNVMRALPPEGRDSLVADIFRRMGKATGEHQNEVGSVFSTNRFLTGWASLSPEAQRAITIGRPLSFIKDLNDVVKIAAHLREGASVFKNPSGSGQAIVAASTAGGLASSVFMSFFYGITPVVLASGTIASTYGAARLFTSPAFVHWLAKSTRAPAEAIPAQLNILGQIAAGEKDDETKKAMLDYMSQISSIIK